MIVHTLIMLIVVMPVIWLVYNTVKLGRTTFQAVITTAYIAMLGMLVAGYFLFSQLWVLPRLFQ